MKFLGINGVYYNAERIRSLSIKHKYETSVTKKPLIEEEREFVENNYNCESNYLYSVIYVRFDDEEYAVTLNCSSGDAAQGLFNAIVSSLRYEEGYDIGTERVKEVKRC